MVKKYIIKINCTSIIELAYNGKIISEKNDIPEPILEDLKKDILDKIGININKILIISRTLKERLRTLRLRTLRLRTLQFEYESENELNREEFVNFIKILKSFNFNPYEEKDDEINENKKKKKFNKNTLRYIELIRELMKMKNIENPPIFEYIYKTEEEKQQLGHRNKKPNRSKYKTITLYNNK
jgi:hypothetical protein